MDDVILVRNSDGGFEWWCEHCQSQNIETRSFVGQVACQGCKRSSFVKEVLR